MANQIIDIPLVGQVEFPDTMSDADISAAAAKLHLRAVTNTPQGETPQQAVTRLAAERAPGGPLNAQALEEAGQQASMADTAKRFAAGGAAAVKALPMSIWQGIKGAGQVAKDVMSPTPEGVARNTELVKNVSKNAYGFVRNAVTGNLTPEEGGAAVVNLAAPMAVTKGIGLVRAAIPEAATVANAGEKLTHLANSETAAELAKHSVVGAAARAAAKTAGHVLTRVGTKPVAGLEPGMANVSGHVPGPVPEAPSANIVPPAPVVEPNAPSQSGAPLSVYKPSGPAMDTPETLAAAKGFKPGFEPRLVKQAPLAAADVEQAASEGAAAAGARQPKPMGGKAPVTVAAPPMPEGNLLERLQGHKTWDSFKQAVDDLSAPESGKLDAKKIVQQFTKEGKFGDVFAEMGAKSRADRIAVVRAARGGGMGKLPQVAIDEVDDLMKGMTPEQGKNYYYSLGVHKNQALGEYVRRKLGLPE